MSLDFKDTISNNINNLIKQNNVGAGENNSLPGANLNHQELIDKALVNAGLPQNKLNSLISMAKDKLMCDDACQKNRKTGEYKKKWELAKKQYKEAPEEVKQAEKNYYVFDKGYPAYKEMLYDRYTKSAEEFKKKSNIKFKTVNSELVSSIDNYQAATVYLKRMNELLKIKLQENEDLKRDIDKNIDNNQTNSRKVVYEDRARDWLGTVKGMFLFIYFGLLIWYIILGPFIPEKKYLNWKVWFLIVTYSLFPAYKLPGLVKMLIFIYEYINSWRLPKDVYRNL